MANPDPVSLVDGTITKVATGVITGSVKKISAEKNAVISETYRLTGEDAPTDKTEFALAFENSIVEPIGAVELIDVYLLSTGGNSVVRVDV